ncbi:ATP/GTP-binding protein [Streptomyces sp. MS1.AVA.4]|uniref:ATP/GTP-binding protein n=1 Tax=Streptomyces pratisoli TaxID=3139917 RepID=A0ACC6Q9E3_9ACTN
MAAALALPLVLAAGPAAADPDVDVGGCDLESFCVGVGVDGNPGSSAGSDDKPAASKGNKPVCTVRKLDPQPPAGGALWGDQSPSDGAVYERVCLTGPGGTPVITTFVADGAAGVPAVDPAVVAQQAVDKMRLSGPDIASPRPAGKYIVGVPVWMWVQQSPSTFGPNTASATAGGVTVTATAKVTKIVWKMGDGSTVTCNGPGTPYKASYGKQDSPSCGHTYTRTSASRSGGAYALTATSTWTVDWQVSGSGESGQLTEIRQSQEQVAIGELQVVG